MNRLQGFLAPLIAVGLLFLPACSGGPTDTPVSPNAEATGHIDPNNPGGVLLGTVTAGQSPAMVEVWAHNLTAESDEIVSFDAVIINTCRCPIAAPLQFIVTQVTPDVIQVENADMDGPEGPIFDFSDDIGDDGVLGPLESSEPVKMRFRWPEPMAFAIGFRVEAGPVGGSISGIVFNDQNADGVRDDTEPGIPGVVVELRPSVHEVLYRVETDASGHYAVDHLDADVYRAQPLPTPNRPRWPTTPIPLVISLVELPDGSVSSFEDADFGFLVDPEPPPHGATIFGPVDVGPGSSNGTELDSTFVVPLFFAPVDFYLVVMPPPILGPLPIHIDRAFVTIDNIIVWEFECAPPDSMCAPAAKVPLDLYLNRNDETMERHIHITTEGDERSFLMYSIVAENSLTR